MKVLDNCFYYFYFITICFYLVKNQLQFWVSN